VPTASAAKGRPLDPVDNCEVGLEPLATKERKDINERILTDRQPFHAIGLTVVILGAIVSHVDAGHRGPPVAEFGDAGQFWAPQGPGGGLGDRIPPVLVI
jgi:hypothetical protein